MSQLGERLRAARESQGINLAQAAVETRILQRYLVALEDGDFQHLPGDVYARGFIRNYASFLGIPAEELIEQYRYERGVTDQIRIVPATSTPRIRGLFIPSFFGVFFVVLALVGMSYLALNLTDNLGERQVADLPEATAAPTPQPLPTWPAQPTSVGSLASAPTQQAVPEGPAGGEQPTPEPTPPPPEAPIVGEVRIAPGDHNGSWLRIIKDGVTDYQGTLKPGEARKFTANSDVTIRVGNAGVVSVVVNGVDQGSLGAPGKAINFTWPPR